MKSWHLVLALVFVVILAGWGSGQAAPADEGGGETYASTVLDTSYPGALPVNSQLALGTIRLEETENAVTSKQAKALLPLWQALRGGVTARAEVNAVLKQIEGTMTAEQLETIATMQLTQEDLRAWMEEQGLNMGAGGAPPRMGNQGQEPSPEMQATRQAMREAGGFGPPGDLSEEERAAMRATAEAGGGRAGDGRQQFAIPLGPLIELLKVRAGEE